MRYAAGRTDWSPYRAFVVEVFNPGEPFALNVRIDDDGDCSTYGRRFNRRLTLERGWNRVELPTAAIERGPRERLLDLRRISWVYLFTGKHDAPRTFHLDRARLE